jgi:hypothetical protein
MSVLVIVALARTPTRVESLFVLTPEYPVPRGIGMDIWGRLFRRRRAAEAAFHRAIGAAEERVLTPIGPRKSAERGAKIRTELLAIVEEVEAKSGSHAFVFAADEQQLMTSQALEDAITGHPTGDLLRPAFSLMFTTGQSKRSLLEHWGAAVDGYVGEPNTRDRLREKAALVASYVLHHYDLPCLALSPDRHASELEDETEEELKLEAASAWYRIVDELAYRHMGENRDLFCDYLQDQIAHDLALQGCSVASILDRANERGEEYARVRDWLHEPPHEDRALLWITARYAIAALGQVPTPDAIRTHIGLLLEALEAARLRDLLSGRRDAQPYPGTGDN